MDEANTTLLTVIEPQILPPEDGEYDADLAYARENIHVAIKKAQKGLDDLSEIAFSSQQSRAYEVENQYIKTISDLSKDLVQISKTKKQAKEGTGGKGGKVQNNLFIGSTAELAKMLKSMKEDPPKKA